MDDCSVWSRTIEDAWVKFRFSGYFVDVEQDGKGLLIRNKNVGNGPYRIREVGCPQTESWIRIHGKTAEKEMVMIA